MPIFRNLAMATTAFFWFSLLDFSLRGVEDRPNICAASDFSIIPVSFLFSIYTLSLG